MTIALAGVNCQELFTLLVTFFGNDTGIDPFSFLDAAPKIPVPLDLMDMESEEEVGGDGSSTAEGSGVVSSSILVPPTPQVSVSPSTAATPIPPLGTASPLSTIPVASSSTATSLQLQAQPSASTTTPASVPVVISTKSMDPQPSSSGVLGEPPAKRSVYVHDKPTRLKWLTFVQLSDTIHQMPTHYITQGSPRSMLLGMQEHLVVGPPCTIAPTPIFAALPLM